MPNHLPATCRSFCDPLDSSQLLIPSKLVAVAAPPAVTQTLVIHALAEHAVLGQQAGVIIGDNRFDDRALFQQVKALGYNPKLILDQIVLSRAEVCHKVQRRILTLEPENLKTWFALFVSGMLQSFYDESISFSEAQWLLRTSLVRLREIARTGLSVLITFTAPQIQGRERFLKLVSDAADLYWQYAASAPSLPEPPPLALPLPGMGV